MDPCHQMVPCYVRGGGVSAAGGLAVVKCKGGGEWPAGPVMRVVYIKQ